MAATEYLCILIRNRPGKWHTAAGQDTIGQQFSFRFDLDSLQSRMNALAFAMETFGGKHPASIEQYGLQVFDAEGVLLATLQTTDEDLRQFREGYAVNVAEGVSPAALANYSNDQLIAELRRRMGYLRLKFRIDCSISPRLRGSQVNQQLFQLGFLNLDLFLILEMVRDIFELVLTDPPVEEVARVATDFLRTSDTHQWYQHEHGADVSVPAHESKMSTFEINSGPQLELLENAAGTAKSLSSRIDAETANEAPLVGPREVDVLEPRPDCLLSGAQQHLEGRYAALPLGWRQNSAVGTHVALVPCLAQQLPDVPVCQLRHERGSRPRGLLKTSLQVSLLTNATDRLR